MIQLLRISNAGKALPVPEEPFASESDLEDFIKANPAVLGDKVTAFAEQIDTGLGDRLDLLALDESLETAQLLLVELKNQTADVKVLLQVLRYAGWVSGSPDSVRLLLEKKKVDTDKVELKPKIVVVAPTIADELVELSQYTSAFEFAFVEVRRFRAGDERFVTVERKASKVSTAPAVRPWEEWNWERYERDLGVAPDRITLAKALVAQLETIFAEKDWHLEMKFRKGYTPFQLPGGWNVIGTEGRWKSGWTVWFMLPDSPEALDLGLPAWVEEKHWAARWHQFYLNVKNEKADLRELLPLLERAYDYVRAKAGL
jgi:hypothetical protein